MKTVIFKSLNGCIFSDADAEWAARAEKAGEGVILTEDGAVVKDILTPEEVAIKEEIAKKKVANNKGFKKAKAK